MKLIATITFLLVLVTGQGQVKQGYKIGLNSSTFVYNKNYIPKNQIGLNVGVLIRLPLQKNFFLQPELLYSLKGHKIEGPVYDGNLNLHYLTLPLMTGYSCKKLSFLAGPEFGYLLYQQYKIKPAINFAETHRKIDLSMNAGIRYKIIGGLGIEIRYNYGILKTNEVPEFDSEGFLKSKSFVGHNRTIQVDIDYTLGK